VGNPAGTRAPRARDAAVGPGAHSHSGKALRHILERCRARSCSSPAKKSWRAPRWASSACRSACAAGCSCAATATAASSRRWCTSRASASHRRAAAHRSLLKRPCVASSSIHRAAGRVALAQLHLVVRPRTGEHVEVDTVELDRAWPTCCATGRTTCARR
jgi:hypothetical protein